MQRQTTQTADRLSAPPPDDTRQVRAQLRRQLSASGFEILDTPRGLVAVIPNNVIETNAPAVLARLGTVASALANYRGLRVEVDGNSEGGSSESVNYRISEGLAAHIRDMLVGQGVPPAAVTVRAFGSSRPMASNQTASGREQNRRVEVVISGDVIGRLPVWDRPYTLDRRPSPR
jgi:flagellar motor protein MotB